MAVPDRYAEDDYITPKTEKNGLMPSRYLDHPTHHPDRQRVFGRRDTQCQPDQVRSDLFIPCDRFTSLDREGRGRPDLRLGWNEASVTGTELGDPEGPVGDQVGDQVGGGYPWLLVAGCLLQPAATIRILLLAFSRVIGPKQANNPQPSQLIGASGPTHHTSPRSKGPFSYKHP
jgi:hypothetical protein